MRIVDRFPHEVVEDRLRIRMSDDVSDLLEQWGQSGPAMRDTAVFVSLSSWTF